MQILRLRPRPTESETVGVGPAARGLSSSPGDPEALYLWAWAGEALPSLLVHDAPWDMSRGAGFHAVGACRRLSVLQPPGWTSLGS